MVKKSIIIVFVSILLAACGREQPYTALPVNANVVILGDSLTYGSGAGRGEDYASILAINTRWNVINAGVPGNTSANGLARLPELFADHDTGEQIIDLLIVELGGNDFLKKVPEVETASNLKAILKQAKAKGIQTVLLAIPEFSPVGAAFGNLSDHSLYATLAEETETPLVEEVFTEVLARNSLKADPIHPNADGYRMVEANLRNALLKLGFLKLK
ncbi:MAG: GDSL-type esterase/lipase family protein [Methylotenera sp.]|nr:GDSL-type esterase/lipase family protein [Methylotenera sp.]